MHPDPLLRAEISEKVKPYWLILALIICFCGVVTIALLPLIIPIIMIVSGKYLASLSVELFERKLSVKKGVLVKVEKSVPLEKITDISLVQGPLMRAFGLYRLNFETAGQSGEGALVSIIGIIDAEQFRERVLEQKDAIAGVNAGSESTTEQQDPLLTSVLNIEKLLTQLVESKDKD